MIKKKYIALILILSLFSVDINNVYADGSCTKEDEKEFREYSRDFKVTYEFNLETKDYTVTLVNPKPDKYRYIIQEITFSNAQTQNIENNTIYYNIPSGKYIIKVFENDGGCKTILKEIEIDLPRYNIYYGDPLCEGIEEFVLCQPTYKREIDRETFEYRINDYKNKKNEQEEIKKELEKKEKKQKIINYIKNNPTQVIIITIFIILVTITSIISIKMFRKSRRLE